MIQRIQTIFLFLAAGGFFGQFLTDFAKSSAPIPVLMSDSVYEIQDHPILLGLTLAGGLLALISIFLFNNRPLQMRLSIVTLIAAIFLPLVAFLLIYNEKTSLEDGIRIEDGIGAYLPIVSILMAFLAYRGIKKDDNIVRSMDRLR
jgi:hypothetical protein